MRQIIISVAVAVLAGGAVGWEYRQMRMAETRAVSAERDAWLKARDANDATEAKLKAVADAAECWARTIRLELDNADLAQRFGVLSEAYKETMKVNAEWAVYTATNEAVPPWKTRAAWNKMRQQMTPDEVTALLGSPPSYDNDGSGQTWYYPDILGGRVSFSGRYGVPVMVTKWTEPKYLTN